QLQPGIDATADRIASLQQELQQEQASLTSAQKELAERQLQQLPIHNLTNNLATAIFEQTITGAIQDPVAVLSKKIEDTNHRIQVLQRQILEKQKEKEELEYDLRCKLWTAFPVIGPIIAAIYSLGLTIGGTAVLGQLIALVNA